jgi:SOS response regulatory protein OraA/RecX
MEIYLSSIRAGELGEIAVIFELRDMEKRSTSRFLISDARYAELALSVGMSDRETYDEVEREARIYATYKKALYLLGFSSCSKKMLKRKLLDKGYEAEFSAVALDRLEASGLFREDDFALREAEKCLQKLWGEGRIRAHLYDKGYSREAVDSVFFAFEDQGVDFNENCAALVKKKFSNIPTDKKEMQKVIAALSRYGYSLSQIKRALG